jgi:hypothetical protein
VDEALLLQYTHLVDAYPKMVFDAVKAFETEKLFPDAKI